MNSGMHRSKSRSGPDGICRRAGDPAGDEPPRDADGVHMSQSLDLEPGLHEQGRQLPLPVAPLMTEHAVDRSVCERMSRNEREQDAPWLQQSEQASQRARVVGDVLQDVEADDRIERFGRGGCQLVQLHGRDLDVRPAGEPTPQCGHERGIGLECDDEASVGNLLGEGSDTGPNVEHTAAEVGRCASEQPAVVVRSLLHPAERLALLCLEDDRRGLAHARIRSPTRTWTARNPSRHVIFLPSA